MAEIAGDPEALGRVAAGLDRRWIAVDAWQTEPPTAAGLAPSRTWAAAGAANA